VYDRLLFLSIANFLFIKISDTLKLWEIISSEGLDLWPLEVVDCIYVSHSVPQLDFVIAPFSNLKISDDSSVKST